MDLTAPESDKSLVEQLIAQQFPEFGHLAIKRVLPGGWDNVTYRLGDDLSIRLPAAVRYAPQIAREEVAFECLAGRLSVAIPSRVRTGLAGPNFPHAWAINRWLEGAPANSPRLLASDQFGAICGRLLRDLHGLQPNGALNPGPENFYRGGTLLNYGAEMNEALSRVHEPVLRERAEMLWCRALTSEWDGVPRWVHGDFFPWNLLVDRSDRLCGLIDWGLAAIGDPAGDLAIAWTCLDFGARQSFRSALTADEATWNRGRGWALWKALTLATRVNQGPPNDVAESWAVLDRICADET